jgi:hypothetical protein
MLRIALPLVALMAATTAQAEEMVFSRVATPAELEPVRMAAPEIVQQAQATPPMTAWAADGSVGRVAVRIEAQGVCGTVGCPTYILAGGRVTWRGTTGETADWPQ